MKEFDKIKPSSSLFSSPWKFEYQFIVFDSELNLTASSFSYKNLLLPETLSPYRSLLLANVGKYCLSFAEVIPLRNTFGWLTSEYSLLENSISD